MKRLLVILDGAADAPSPELENATPLELARLVNTTTLATRGACGWLRWPDGEEPSSAVQQLALLLGIAPAEARLLRRGPVEALATGLAPDRWTYAYRGNFITTDGSTIREDRVSDLTLDETHWLTNAIIETKPDHVVAMTVVDAGRVSVLFDHLKGTVDPGTSPESGSRVPNLEAKATANNDRLRLMQASTAILAGQAVNDVRVDLGENPASMLWLWGGGASVAIGRPFLGAPLQAVMISNSALARGMASLCRMEHIDLGDVWTESSRPTLIEADRLAHCMEQYDLTVLYVEAPRESSRFGSPVEKVKALDRLDIHVMARVLEAVRAVPGCRIMLTALPPPENRAATTPLLLCGDRIGKDAVTRWNESACQEGALGESLAERCLSNLVGE